MSAALHYRLDNLTAIVDHNTLQITGRTRDVCQQRAASRKIRVVRLPGRSPLFSGHDFAALTKALIQPLEPGKPSVVIANTRKGRGVSFMEDVGKWHHGVPNDAEYERAIGEINDAISRLEGLPRMSAPASSLFSPAAQQRAQESSV